MNAGCLAEIRSIYSLSKRIYEETTMNTHIDEIGFLTSQLQEIGNQIGILAAKQEAASTISAKCAQEIHELREKHLASTRRLRDYELHQTGLYMWENIGEGG